MSVKDEDDCVIVKQEDEPTKIVILEEKDCKDFRSKSMRHVYAKCQSWDEKETIAISCDICSKTYGSLYLLKRHKIGAHGSETLTCETCGKQLQGIGVKGLLQRHIRQYHPEQKLFKCPACEKSFRWRSEITWHKKIQHTRHELRVKARSLCCKTCQKTFNTQKDYERHMARHVGQSGCTKCEEVFRTYLDKQYHVCSGKEQSTSGENCFICGICSVSFTTQKHLVGHMGLHTGEMQIACGLCNIGFPDSNSYESHKEAVHTLKVATPM